MSWATYQTSLPGVDLTNGGKKEYENLVKPMQKIVKFYNVKRILELGTGNQNSARIFLSVLPGDGWIWTIDKEKRKRVISEAERIEFIQANTWNLCWSKNVDLLYIDAGHNYEEVKMELVTFGRYVRKGGVILLHDINHNESGGDIRRAIFEYLAIKKYEHEDIIGGEGLGIIHVS